MSLRTYGALLTSVLVIGCASGGAKPDTATTDAPRTAAATVAAPLSTPPGSAKKLVLNMTGPSAVTQAKDWPAFQEEWRATFSDYAKQAGVAFDVQTGDPHPVGEPGTLLQVYVNDYRMIGIGARVFFGVMTGNAYIDAKATFTDLNDGKPFGDRIYNTSSTAWAGVFAKMTPQQVDSIASQVFNSWASANPK